MHGALEQPGRDEWMTVIEMQEYIRSSQNKACDLIWSGELNLYWLGQEAPGVEDVSSQGLGGK